MKVKNLQANMSAFATIAAGVIVISMIGSLMTKDRVNVTNIDNVNSNTFINNEEPHERIPYVIAYEENDELRNAVCLAYPKSDNQLEFRDAKSNELLCNAQEIDDTFLIDNESIISITKIAYDVPNFDMGEATAIDLLYDSVNSGHTTIIKDIALTKKTSN